MAIAFDAFTAGSFANPGTSLTWAHTCTGANRILWVGVVGGTAGDGDVISGVTYNGVALTRQASVSPAAGGSARWVYLYYLVGPTTGSNNVVVSASASIFIAGVSSSYTGAKQSAQPDNSTTATGNSSSATATLTTVADNCWTVLFDKDDANAGVGTGGTNTTVRGGVATGDETLGDRNAAITPAGSTSLAITLGGSGLWSAIMASFSPAVFNTGGMFALF